MAKSNKDKFIENYLGVCFSELLSQRWLFVSFGDDPERLAIKIEKVAYMSGRFSFKGVGIDGVAINTYNKNFVKIYEHVHVALLESTHSSEEEISEFLHSGLLDAGYHLFTNSFLKFQEFHEKALIAWKKKQKAKALELQDTEGIKIVKK